MMLVTELYVVLDPDNENKSISFNKITQHFDTLQVITKKVKFLYCLNRQIY